MTNVLSLLWTIFMFGRSTGEKQQKSLSHKETGLNSVNGLSLLTGLFEIDQNHLGDGFQTFKNAGTI